MSRLFPLLFCIAAAPLASSLAEKPDSSDEGGSNSFGEVLGRSLRLDYSFEPESDLDAGGTIQYQEAAFSTPLFGAKLGQDWLVAMRLRYRFAELDWQDQALLDNDPLHRLDLNLSLIYRPESSPWTAFLSAGPALAVDDSGIGDDAWLFTAIAGVGYRFSDRFALLAGAYYSQDFGESRLLPGPGFIWTPSEKWNLSLIPPRLRIAYAPSSDWRVALEAFPNGGRWSVRTLDGQDAFLDRSGARAGLRIERRVIGENGWLHLGAGWVFSRDLTLESERRGILFESDADSGAFISTGFSWRF